MTLTEEQFIRVMLSRNKLKSSRTGDYLMSKIGRSLGKGGGLSSMGSKRSFVREKKGRSRRVILKAFILKNHQNGTSWTEKRQKHANYIQREGVGKEGELGVAYGPEVGPLEVADFIQRGQKDAHEGAVAKTC